MSRRDNNLLLLDMKESTEKVIKYTSGFTLDEFLKDEKTIDAVVRNFEIIGEAANRIEEEFKFANPQIEWRKLRGFRNRIVHEYFGIDLEIVWTIIQEDIDELIYQIDTLLK